MKVLVTGSNGRVGRYTVQDLLEHGYDVTGADLAPSSTVRTYVTDFTDLGQTTSVMHGHDAVIHMAAIPSPTIHPAEVVFQNNVMSTFNVLQAATMLGIKKVVLASSCSALGWAFKFRHFDPEYLPIDEQHPLVSQDAYGLSKVIGEQLGDGFVRRTPDMSVVSMRYNTVFQPGDGLAERLRDRPDDNAGFWGYIDVRDCATVNRLAIEQAAPGHHAYFICAPNIYMRESSPELMQRYMPGVKHVKAGWGGHMAFTDSSLVERELGFRPVYNWDGERFE